MFQPYFGHLQALTYNFKNQSACKLNFFLQIIKYISMHVYIGSRCFILVPEEGQTIRETCSVFYIKLLCPTENCNLLPVNKVCDQKKFFKMA